MQFDYMGWTINDRWYLDFSLFLSPPVLMHRKKIPISESMQNLATCPGYMSASVG